MKKFTQLFFIFHFSFFTFLCEAQILRVPSEYSTIQQGVDAAGYGDTVIVSPGTYLENISIQGNAKVLTLASNFIFSGDTSDINNTIIDASQPQNPNFGMAVLLKNQDTTIMPKISGFTITGGTGYYKTYGGGIYSSNAIPVIEYNVIKDCSITGTQPNGGGIFVGGGNFNTICNIRHNVIKNCTVTPAANGVEANGAGMSLYNVKAVIEDNKISGNNIIGHSSTNAGGGGIIIYNPNEGSVISNNVISNNSAVDGPAGSTRRGGGIYLFRYPSLPLEYNSVIKNNRITGNEAIDGAGLFFQTTGARLVNNFISGNHAEKSGGAIYFQGPADTMVVAEVINNTISDNSAIGEGGQAGSFNFTGTMKVLLMNNIFYGNQAETSDEIKIASSTVQIHNCDINTDEITGNWTGENNFYADPEFIDEMSWDCWATIAPCSNTGIDQKFAFNQWFEAPAKDLMNNDRPQDEFIDVGAVEVDMCYVGYPEAVGGRQSAVGSRRSAVIRIQPKELSIFDFRFSMPGE